MNFTEGRKEKPKTEEIEQRKPRGLHIKEKTKKIEYKKRGISPMDSIV